VLQLNHAIAGKKEPFEHVNIDWGFVLVSKLPSCICWSWFSHFIRCWWRGVVVTCLIRSAKLLYAGPS